MTCGITFPCLLVALVACAPSQARVLTLTEREAIYIDCYRTTGMDPTVVAKAIKEATLLDPTPAYLAQLTCIYKGQGYQNEDGEIVHSEIKQFLSEAFTEEQCSFIVDNCHKTGGTGHGEIAYRALACMLKNMKKIDEDIERENKL